MQGGAVGSVIGVGVFTWLKSLGQIDLLIGLAYVVFLGVMGSLIMVESVRAIHARWTGHAVSFRRRGQHNWLSGLAVADQVSAFASLYFICATGLDRDGCRVYLRRSWELAADFYWFRR